MNSDTALANSQLLNLADQISKLTSEICVYLQSTAQTEPSFDQNSTEIITSHDFDSLVAHLNDNANDLLQLINGPKGTFRSRLAQHYDLAVYQVALSFNFFDIIPVNGTKTVSEIATATGLDKDRVSRVMRMLATQRVFVEVQENEFQHTADSVLLKRDSLLRDTFDFQLDEVFQATSNTAEALRNSPTAPDALNSPFTHRHGASIFEYFDDKPQKAVRFGRAMEGSTKLDRRISDLQDQFDWNLLSEGKVVDVGGANGAISIQLAKKHQNLNFIVQDKSIEMLAEGKRNIAGDIDLASRIEFMNYDFFSPQPVKDAVVFFIRQCLHNWNDEDCVKILKGFVPALESCCTVTPLLINESIMPHPGERSRFEEHNMRQVDISMMILLGSRQRTQTDFQILLTKADPRFKIIKVYNTGPMGLIEACLDK